MTQLSPFGQYSYLAVTRPNTKMKIYRNTKREKELFAAVQKTLEQQREGIHASDLLAPRLSYFRKLHPLPLTAEEVGYFATGHGHHMFLVHLSTGKKNASQEESFVSKEYGITYSPDLAAEKTEFKTARYAKMHTTVAQCEKDFDRYIQQCLIYALCEKVDYWHLLVLYIGLRKIGPDGTYIGGLKAPIPRWFTLRWDEKELQEGDIWLKKQVRLLTDALETLNHKKLPLCEEWQCVRWDPEVKAKVIQCPYWKQCKPTGRYGKIDALPYSTGEDTTDLKPRRKART